MPSNSSNSPSSNSLSASNSCSPEKRALDGQAVKTFAFEATAGRSAQPTDAELPVQTVPKPKYLAHLPLADGVQRPTAYEPLALATENVNDAEASWQISSMAVRPWRRRRSKSAWWTVSLGIHAAIVLGLSLSTFVVMRQHDALDLYASASVYEPIEEFQNFEIEMDERLDTLETDWVSDQNDPEIVTFAELSGAALEESDLEEASESAFVADLVPFANEAPLAEGGRLIELAGLFGAEGHGMTDLATGAGGATVGFFGTKVQASRILYILDNSGGMRHGGKFETLLGELRKSVDALKPKQEFHVLFYSDTVYPLYYPASVRRFVTATDENREHLDRWLDSVEFCVGNAIDEALAAIEVIRPDVVFLLTDGNLFTTEKKKAMLLDPGERRYAIHTFGLGVSKNSKTAAGLQQVAEAHGGTFRVVRVSEADKNSAKQKQRPYHNKQPGAVWGIKVGVRRW